jgi:hypothetical protein
LTPLATTRAWPRRAPPVGERAATRLLACVIAAIPAGKDGRFGRGTPLAMGRHRVRGHHAARRQRRLRCLSAPSARDDGALRGCARQPRDAVRRDRRRGDAGANPQARPQGARGLSRVRFALPGLRPVPVLGLRREPVGGIQLQGARLLPVVSGPADERHGGQPHRARPARGCLSPPVGAHVPVRLEALPCAKRRSRRLPHQDL